MVKQHLYIILQISGHIFFFFTHRSQTVLKRVVVELCDNGFTHLNKRNLLAIYCLHCNHCIILLLLSRSYNTKNVITHNIILSFCQNKPSYTHFWVIIKLWVSNSSNRLYTNYNIRKIFITVI